MIDSNADEWQLYWRASAKAGSHERTHETTNTQRHGWAAENTITLDLRAQAHTNPKWQGGLIMNADLPAIL